MGRLTLRTDLPILPVALFALAAAVAAAVAGSEPGSPELPSTERSSTEPLSTGAVESGPVSIRPGTLDPARRRRLESWWRSLRAAEPVLATVTSHLRRELLAWRGRPPTPPGCQRAPRALAALDRDSLTRDAGYHLTLVVSRALRQLEGAAAACLERRYFEFDYRLTVAEAELEQARRFVRHQLARP
jgi:hypothetical protein